jgi:cytochrome P450
VFYSQDSGVALPSLISTELDALKAIPTVERDARFPDKETLIKNVSATAYVGQSSPLPPTLLQLTHTIPSAGSDTVQSILTSFILSMILHPDIQRRAQAHLLTHLGQTRLPNFSDREHVPYIQCVIYECLRWNPVANLALAHLTTEEDEYRGWRIPKGTAVFANIWYASRLSLSEQY